MRGVKPFGVVLLVIIAYVFCYFCGNWSSQTSHHCPSISSIALKRSVPKQGALLCTCENTDAASRYVPAEEMKELLERRAEEFREHLIRNDQESVMLAPANSPLQYPIRGFRVSPMTPTLVPGLALQTQKKAPFKVSLRVEKGLLTVMDGQQSPDEPQNQKSISANSLPELNEVLSKVTYTSSVYHIRTRDIVYFSFEDHEVTFPVEIRRSSVPVLYDPGKDVNSQVTILVKTFMRYQELRVLIRSIRHSYPKIKIIVADDSREPEKLEEVNVEQFFMPPAKGWFAGRNLALSQVTTKFFLWLDDDFEFLSETRIESFVEIMKANPELDVVGGEVDRNQFFFKLSYEEGNEEGGCIMRATETHAPLPGFQDCFFVDGVVNYFMGRTNAVRRVGFDPFLKRVAHTEFFIDALGDLLVVTCKGLRVGHQKHRYDSKYDSYRHPPQSDYQDKQSHHFFKNYLKCIKY